MSPEHLDAIKARLDATTPGPWHLRDMSGEWHPDRWHVETDYELVAGDCRRANAEFISYARADMRDLVIALEAAEARARDWESRARWGGAVDGGAA